MDKILLTGCRFYGYHGALPEENVLGQIFMIDAELGLDLTAASQSDRLEDTVHYGQVFDVIKYQTENQSYQLLERLGGAICRDVFEQFPTVVTIRLKITKENPPIAGHYDSVGIILERSR